MVKDRTVSSVLLDIFIRVSLLIVLVVTLYPVLNIISISFSSSAAFEKGIITIFPREFNIESYKTILRVGTIPNAMKNSVIYTALGTLVNLSLTSIMAYALANKRLMFKGFYSTLVVITMFFSGGMIPSFLLIKNLGMYDTIWSLIIPGAISPANLIIMRTFFQTIPTELEEAAFIDGAKEADVFFKIVLPLSKASLATIGLFYAVAHWNSWFTALIYLKDSAKYPLQLILRDIVMQDQIESEMVDMANVDPTKRTSVEAIKYATLVVSMVPMMIVYPFVQKYFVKGVMIGSVKG